MFDMNKKIEELKHVLENRPTEELLVIWIERDEETWRPEVFGVIHDILVGRGVNPEEEKLRSETEDREATDEVLNLFSENPELKERIEHLFDADYWKKKT